MSDCFVTPWGVPYQALSMRFSRQEYWSGLPFPSSGDLPNPGIDPLLHCWQADSLPLGHLGSPCWWLTFHFNICFRSVTVAIWAVTSHDFEVMSDNSNICIILSLASLIIFSHVSWGFCICSFAKQFQIVFHTFVCITWRICFKSSWQLWYFYFSKRLTWLVPTFCDCGSSLGSVLKC